MQEKCREKNDAKTVVAETEWSLVSRQPRQADPAQHRARSRRRRPQRSAGGRAERMASSHARRITRRHAAGRPGAGVPRRAPGRLGYRRRSRIEQVVGWYKEYRALGTRY